ncbi:MAG: Endoplasmic reticulum zinc transporter [Phylliscum demangeonii]|nr:MAG: Endoplasmic reticulum zinc transporter [Phylliscum demangeonii]
MASTLPLPAPPRTPTPPQIVEPSVRHSPLLAQRANVEAIGFNSNSLSPLAENFPARYPALSPTTTVPGSPLSPASANSFYSATSFDGAGAGAVAGSQTLQVDEGPFKFKTTTLAKSPVAKSTVGQRRGHKYKHSSVSHQVFLEPAPRAPLALPASLPIPTFRECRKSMSKEQRSRISWCLCHALVAAYTLWTAQGSLAMMALSHLILFDALGATLCVVVDVLGNFEVWQRSSIRHPFGLARAEVLASFAMSVLLLFMGMDLISHMLEHVLESLGHEPHRDHHHQRVSPGGVDVAALLAIISTLVSAVGLGNHARIGKAMRFAYMDSLPSVLSNPSHFLTLSCSALLLLLPLLSVKLYVWLDRVLASTIALAMCLLGVRLVKSLGLMLLMSYSGGGAGGGVGGVAQVIREIEADPAVERVDEARFWQVHYGLCMANLKLRVRAADDATTRLREKMATLIRNRLGGGYGSGSGGQRWEVSTQLTLDRPAPRSA